MRPIATILIPTWNGGEELGRVLDAIEAQESTSSFEVLAIDSGSSDGTPELLESRGARVIRIPRSRFDHGRTRALGVREARGRIVVQLVQDARPADSGWLDALLECFDDPRVAGAYSAQEARPDASPFVRDRLRRWAAGASRHRIQELRGESELAALTPLERLDRVAFDNVSSAVRRRVALRIPFRELTFGEDLDWSRRVLLAGHRIVFRPSSAVIHSHDRSSWYELRRITLDHANLRRLFGIHTVPTLFTLLRGSVSDLPRLWRIVDEDDRDLGPLERWSWKARALPYSITQNLGQYLGAASVGPDKGPLDRLARAFVQRIRKSV